MSFKTADFGTRCWSSPWPLRGWLWLGVQQLIYGGFAEGIQKVIRTNFLAFVQSEDDKEWLGFKNLYTYITAWPWPSQELQRSWSCSCLLKWTPKNLVAWFALGCLIEIVVIWNPLIISPFETSGTFTTDTGDSIRESTNLAMKRCRRLRLFEPQ